VRSGALKWCLSLEHQFRIPGIQVEQLVRDGMRSFDHRLKSTWFRFAFVKDATHEIGFGGGCLSAVGGVLLRIHR
jgi:hypothetical protein